MRAARGSKQKEVMGVIRSEPYKTATYYAHVTDISTHQMTAILHVLTKNRKISRGRARLTGEKKVAFHYWPKNLPAPASFVTDSPAVKKVRHVKPVSFWAALRSIVRGVRLYREV